MVVIRGRPQVYLALALGSAASLGGYLLASSRTYRTGFPLDDAWIHQTFARNLAQYGQWAFVPGQPSAGSTAPLWSGLLSLGYLFHLNPYLWSFLLGWLLLFAIAVLGVHAFRDLCPSRAKWAAWAGLGLALEWHLAWAAGSGMETLLFALLVLIVLAWLVRGGVNWFRLGLLVGLSAWVRPDGITLVGPALLALWFGEPTWRRRSVATLRLGLGVLLFFAPYLAFNRLLAGAWWPNTFFAKQAEYEVLRQLPLWRRYGSEAGLPLVGVGVVLLPGFGWYLWSSVRRRAWGAIAGAIWFLGYLWLYAWRLPVTYQHGRYVMPAMPVYLLWGFAGLAYWVGADLSSLWGRVLARAWMSSAALVLLLFWPLGARAYGQDVAIIESEMVATARWVAENTEPGALVAAHDIGALGYFGQRPLLDLAGLVSPQVIPFIRDEPRLELFLNARRARYLVTFPDWYPGLTRHATLIFSTQGRFSPAAGGENMAVYRWDPP